MKDRKASQCDKVLAFMKQHGSITQADAVYQLNTFRLSARIADLKKRGYDITSVIAEGVDKEGKRVRFARYSLREGK